MLEHVSILIVGVGGQGTLLTSKILGYLLKEEGFDVKVSEVHGMSQRGGSVVTYVKYGEKVHSPLIEPGEADIIIAFELLEALRWSNFLKKGGRLVASSQKIDPMPVITGKMKYPNDAKEQLYRSHPDAIVMDALTIAQECGNKKSTNIVMLGAVAVISDFAKDKWINALKKVTPQAFLDVNLRAFEGGYQAAAAVTATTKAVRE